MGVFRDLIVTKPISAITNAISGCVAKIAAPVVGLGKTALGDVTGVAKSAISTAGQAAQGISSAADCMVSHVLTPLSSGLGSGISSLGGGIMVGFRIWVREHRIL